jgi:hypothetical protein
MSTAASFNRINLKQFAPDPRPPLPFRGTPRADFLLGELSKHIDQTEKALMKTIDNVKHIEETYLTSIKTLQETLIKTLPKEIAPLIKEKLETDPQFIQGIFMLVIKKLEQEGTEKDKKIKELENTLQRVIKEIKHFHPESKL